MSEAAFEPAQLSPHSQDAEEAVLGSILINPDAFEEVMAILISDDFFILRNAWVFEAMLRLYRRGEVIDYLTLIEELRRQDRLDDIGGAAYVTYLTSNVGTSIYAETYAQIVYRASVRRTLLDASIEIARLAREEELDVNEVLDKSLMAVLDIVERRTEKPLEPAEEALYDLVDTIADIAEGKVEPLGVKTYYEDLDEYLTGGVLEPGCWILSSDTSGGKTMWTINTLYNQSAQQIPTALFTLEMTKAAVLRRMLAMKSTISTTLLSKGIIPPEKVDQYQDAISTVGNVVRNVLIDDSHFITIHQIMVKIRRAVREFGLRIAYVDYAGLISDEGLDEDNRAKVLGKMARLLHLLGLQLKIPIVLGAQQNRDGGGKKGIAESYEMVQHCQGMLYIENADPQQDPASLIQEKRVVLAKQRDGQAGVGVRYIFNLPIQLITAKDGTVSHDLKSADALAELSTLDDMLKP